MGLKRVDAELPTCLNVLLLNLECSKGTIDVSGDVVVVFGVNVDVDVMIDGCM